MGEESDRKVDIVGTTSDGKPFMRKGPFKGRELSQYLLSMIGVLGENASIGDLLRLKASQQRQKTMD